MNTLINSYAVSPSGGDMRGDGLVPWGPRMSQDRFGDIPSLADAVEKARSHSNGDSEGDPGTDVQREEDTLIARQRDPSTAQGYCLGVVVTPGNPAQPLAQTRGEARQSDPFSERSGRKTYDDSVTAPATNVEKNSQAAAPGSPDKDGQHAQTGRDVVRKNGGAGAPASGASASKTNSAAAADTMNDPARKPLSRKRSGSLAACERPEARSRGSGLENQPRAGSGRGGAPGSLNPALEVVLSRAKETHAGGLKSGAGVSPGPSASFVGPPTVAGPHTAAATALYGGAEGGMGESVSQNMGEQILDSLKAAMTQGDRQVLIRLQPPELGMVLVRFREQGEGLEGTLRVERADTRREIEQALSEVVHRLQDAGIGIRRLDVTDNDPAGQDLGGGRAPQDGSSGYRDAGQPHDSLRTSGPSRPPAAADSVADARRAPDLQHAAASPQGRIDLLL